MAKTPIAILGAGNGGHAASGDLTLRGFDVRLYEDPNFAGKIKNVFDTKQIKISGACGDATVTLSMVTTDMKKAVTGVKCILVTVPAFAHNNIATQLAEFVQSGQIVFVLPGTFGSLAFYKIFKQKGVKDVILAETNTLPYATRLKGPGDSMIMSIFNPTKIGVLPANKTEEVMPELLKIFPFLEPVESVIACGLSSLNPVIHVPGCILNAGYCEMMHGDYSFYKEGFPPIIAHVTELLDKERISLLQLFGYKWDTAAHCVGGPVICDDLHRAIAGNADFAKIKAPPDFKHRYYAEDIPFGIAIWAKLAHNYGVKVPLMDSMVNIGNALMGSDCWEKGRQLEDLGITEDLDLETLKQFLITG